LQKADGSNVTFPLSALEVCSANDGHSKYAQDARSTIPSHYHADQSAVKIIKHHNYTVSQKNVPP